MSSSSLITWPRPKNKGDISEIMNLLKLFIWSLPGPRSGKKIVLLKKFKKGEYYNNTWDII